MKQRRDVEWAQSLFFCFNKEENNGDNSANYKMKVGGGREGERHHRMEFNRDTFTYYTQVTKWRLSRD